MSEKLELLHTDRVLIVEGKYDAARLSHLTDAMILLTDGFGIYKDKKRQQLFKQLAHKNGLILLTDSDAAGFRIRTYITNLVGEKNVVSSVSSACPACSAFSCLRFFLRFATFFTSNTINSIPTATPMMHITIIRVWLPSASAIRKLPGTSMVNCL